MTLYKRRKVWWVEYQVDGVRHRQSTHTRNYAAAKAWAAQIETARKMPTFEEAVEVLKMFYRKPVEGLLPIESTWEVYLDLAKSTGKTAIGTQTLERRRNQVERFIRWLKAERPTVKTIEGVTGPIAAGFASHLTKAGLKSKTRINILADLTTVWKLLGNASTQVVNPWPSLRPQDVDGEVGKAFTPEEERRVIEAAKAVGKDWFAVCTIMRHTGLRYGDVARMRWCEVDLESRVIRMTPNKTARHGIKVALPLIEPVIEVLAGLERRGEFLFPLHSELYGNRGRVSRETLNFRAVLEAAGLDGQGFTIHSWRHTAATRLAESGASKETRKALLGHTVDATAERYDHSEHLTELREAIEAAAGGEK